MIGFPRVLQGLLKKHLTQKRIIALIALGVLVVFRAKFAVLLTDFLVTPILSWCTSDLPTDFVLVAISVSITGMFLLRAKRGYVTSLDSVLFAAIVSAIYLFYRVQSTTWEFVGFHLMPSVKYADILILWSAGTVSVWAKAFFTKSQDNSPRPLRFSLDEPIHNIEEDALERTPLAKLLAERIRQTQGAYSFAVGITGSWGSGKTSFMNLLKEHLEYDEVILVDFNPWLGSESDLIVKDFFQTLRSHLKPYSSQIDGQLEEYSSKFVDIEGGWVSKSLKAGIGLFTESSVKEGFDRLNKSLNRLNKQVIVFIDDLDRLDDAEILSVLRLIRNTANFSSLKFIVAFDRKYVESAVEKINRTNHTSYLDKIFLHYTPLTAIDFHYLKEELEADLINRFPDQASAIGDTLTNRYAYGKEIHVKKFIKSIRDLKRFINQFSVDYDEVKAEVHFPDYLKVQLLKFKYTSVYMAFYEHMNRFIEVNPMVSHWIEEKKQYRLIKPSNTSTGKDSTLTEYLTNHADLLGITNDDIEVIIETMEKLFDHKTYTFGASGSHLSIIYPPIIDRYFKNRISENDLSEKEFEQAIKQPLHDLQSQIVNWVNEGKKISVVRRYTDVNVHECASREEFEKLIRSIIFLGKYKNPKESGYQFGYYSRDLISKLSDYDERISKRFYQGNGREYKDFVLRLFSEAESPFTFESDFLSSVVHGYHDSFIVSLEEAQNQCVHYLRTYLDSAQTLDTYCWDLYAKCNVSTRIDTGPQTFQLERTKHPDANKAFIEFVKEKALDEFLVKTVVVEGRDQSLFEVSNVVVRMFGSFEQFAAFLDEQDHRTSEYLEEYKEFLKVFMANEPKIYVPFEFKVIPVQKKMRE